MIDVGDEQREAYLDMALENGDTTRNLRFFSPISIEIERGFPSPTWGMLILDISDRQMQGINVEVTDFENTHGKISFFARQVIDLNEMSKD